MKLFIGLVTYGESSLKYLPESLLSLQNALKFFSPDDYQVVIFDNSELGDKRNREFISQYYPKFQINYQEQNLGFAKAYNILINQAREKQVKYFFMMNPDILLKEDSLELLVNALEKNRDLATACPKIYHWPFPDKPKEKIIDTCGLVLASGLKFSDLGQGRLDDTSFDHVQILGPSGAAGIFRLADLVKVAVDKVGKKEYFDERMFMYKEDCDLAYRLSLLNLKTILVKEAIAWHDRSVSDPGRGLFATLRDRRNKSKQARRWSFVNQHLIFIKHYSRENFVSRFKIIFSILVMFGFALVRERFLLKEYQNILFKIRKNRDNC